MPEVIRRKFAHVSDLNKLEAALVCPENVVAYRLEENSLPDLGPSLQVLKLTVLAEVADQVYETMRPYSARRSATRWLCGLLTLSMSR